MSDRKEKIQQVIDRLLDEVKITEAHDSPLAVDIEILCLEAKDLLRRIQAQAEGYTLIEKSIGLEPNDERTIEDLASVVRNVHRSLQWIYQHRAVIILIENPEQLGDFLKRAGLPEAFTPPPLEATEAEAGHV